VANKEKGGKGRHEILQWRVFLGMCLAMYWHCVGYVLCMVWACIGNLLVKVTLVLFLLVGITLVLILLVRVTLVLISSEFVKLCI